MKAGFIFTVFLCLLCPLIFQAQNFTFDPGPDYEAVLPMDSYTDHFVYVYHDSPDSALISWRVVGNTCPEEWHISLCDWADCYSYLPNTGDMLPVAPEASGFIKLTMNPFMIPGEGTVHFWIYPTGHQEEHIDLFYHFSTELVSVAELNSISSAYPNPFTTEIRMDITDSRHIRITDSVGRILYENHTEGSSPISVSTIGWSPGVYFLQIDSTTQVLYKF